MKNQENKLYQLTCLFDAATDPEKINQIIEGIKQTIVSNEGDTSKRSYSSTPINKKLAYPIKNKNEALYWELNFSLSPKNSSRASIND